jgi:hypothetical protein
VARGDLHALKLLSGGVYDISLTFDELPPQIEAQAAALHPVRMKVTGATLELGLKEDHQGVLEAVSRLTAGGRVRRVEIGGASLEDVFVELTSAGKEGA